jgi:hypothetical protein
VAQKHWKCSIGDCKWGLPYSSLPYGLQMYLLWDIQHMAKVVLVMLMLWVIALHIFPEPVFMHRAEGRDGREVAEYWSQQVLRLMGDERLGGASLSSRSGSGTGKVCWRALGSRQAVQYPAAQPPLGLP